MNIYTYFNINDNEENNILQSLFTYDNNILSNYYKLYKNTLNVLNKINKEITNIINDEENNSLVILLLYNKIYKEIVNNNIILC